MVVWQTSKKRLTIFIGDRNRNNGVRYYYHNYSAQWARSDQNLVTNTPIQPYASTQTVTTTSISISTTTASVCSTRPSTPLVSTCATPTGAFKMGVQNFGGACMSTQYGGAVPNQDHDSLVLTTLAGNCTTFNAVSNGQTTVKKPTKKNLDVKLIKSAGVDNWRINPYAGNGAVYFDSINSIQNSQYGTYSEAVQFCLQPDNTFIVQNPSIGANVLQLCNNRLYLYTAGNATNSGCTSITLLRGVGAAPPSY
ncbi:hypothetical protein LTS12_000255 [Elasticomyces elasticus]|nr:hypothetical protein LTS12_000255 [Elasticomyces elasticus]